MVRIVIDGASLVERIRAMINGKESVVTDPAIPVAANLNPGVIVTVAFPAEDE